MKKDKFFVFGMSVMALALSFILAGCSDPNGGTDDPAGTGGGNNPFKGTWTGQGTTPGGPSTVTVVFDDTTFETTTALDNGFTIKQKRTYTYTSTSVNGVITAVNALKYDGTRDSGWVSEGEIFETYNNGGSLNGTLLNGKLISGDTQLVKK